MKAYAELKISVSGLSECGRPELVKALSKSLGLPVISIDFKSVYDAKQKFLKTKNTKDNLSDEGKDALKAWVQAYLDLLKTMNEKRSGLKGYILDRWELDLFALWLKDFASFQVDKMTVNFLKQLTESAKEINYAAITPPLKLDEEEKLSEKPLTRPLCKRIDEVSVLRGLIGQYSRIVLINLPMKKDAAEVRATTIKEAIDKNLKK